ncbi:hypothetical protein NKH77_18010 [Streptomyces sp. M19]
MEREAPGRLRPGAGRGPLARRGPRGARRRGPPRRADPAGTAPERRLPAGPAPARGAAAAERAVADGLLLPEPYAAGRAVLTLRGRLLADAVVRDLVD